MSCDIHILYQKKTPDGWISVSPPAAGEYSDGPFTNRCYAIFAFLADVRNYSAITPISAPRGLPDDLNDDSFKQDSEDYGHTPSWLTVAELLTYNYDQEVEDRRVGKQVAPNIYDGAWQCPPGEGKKLSLAAYLGLLFFKDLLTIHRAGIDRIVFCFDN